MSVCRIHLIFSLDFAAGFELEQRPKNFPTLHGLNVNPRSSHRLLNAFAMRFFQLNSESGTFESQYYH